VWALQFGVRVARYQLAHLVNHLHLLRVKKGQDLLRRLHFVVLHGLGQEFPGGRRRQVQAIVSHYLQDLWHSLKQVTLFDERSLNTVTFSGQYVDSGLTFNASLEGQGKGDRVCPEPALKPDACPNLIQLLGDLQCLLEILGVDARLDDTVAHHVRREREGVLRHLLVQIQGFPDVARL